MLRASRSASASRASCIPPGAGVASALGFLAAPPSIDLHARVRDPAARRRCGPADSDLRRDAHASRAPAARGRGRTRGHLVRLLRRALLRRAGLRGGNAAPRRFRRRRRSRHARGGIPRALRAALRSRRPRARREGAELAPGRDRPAADDRARRGLAGEVRAARAPGSRDFYFPEAGGFVECAVHDRKSLEVGESVPGPAIVEEAESTVVLTPAMNATVLRGGSLLAVVGRPASVPETRSSADVAS